MATAVPKSTLGDELVRLFAGDEALLKNPYPVYDRLREEAPVYRHGERSALIAKHADVKACYRDQERFPATPTRGYPFDGRLRLLSEDDLRTLDEVHRFEANYISRKNGVDHKRVRTAAHRYFTPKRVAELESRFQRVFDELIEPYEHGDVFDFIEVAYRLPLLVIMELLGVPREDAERVKAWGDAINPIQRNPLRPELVHGQLAAIQEQTAYVRELIERHRRSPETTGLVASVLDAADGDRLSQEELVAFFVHTLFAGHETTQHMIGNGLYTFMRHREQWELLCRDPSLATSATEEVMRFDSPVASISKITACDVELRGVRIPKGITVLLMMAAADRDPEVFDEPERFDITRTPNDHLALGFGPHFCLGASLARVEGKIVFGTLARRFPELQLAVSGEELRFHPGIRGLDELPIRPRGER